MSQLIENISNMRVLPVDKGVKRINLGGLSVRVPKCLLLGEWANHCLRRGSGECGRHYGDCEWAVDSNYSRPEVTEARARRGRRLRNNRKRV